MASRVTAGQVEREAAKPLAYFSHDTDAARDPKCRKLLRRHGMEGYGRWWRLCELLGAADGHALPVQEAEDADMLADDLMFQDVDGLMRWLSEIAGLGLIDLDRLGDGEVWSDRMGRNAQIVGKQRAAGSLGGRPRKGGRKHEE